MQILSIQLASNKARVKRSPDALMHSETTFGTYQLGFLLLQDR